MISTTDGQIDRGQYKRRGAFLNAFWHGHSALAVPKVEMLLSPTALSFEDAVVRMFQGEWKHQRETGTLRRIAIVDDRPEEQILSRVRAGEAIAYRARCRGGHRRRRQSSLHAGRLWFDGKEIDLVYNRVIDFALIGRSIRRCGGPIGMARWS